MNCDFTSYFSMNYTHINRKLCPGSSKEDTCTRSRSSSLSSQTRFEVLLCHSNLWHIGVVGLTCSESPPRRILPVLRCKNSCSNNQPDPRVGCISAVRSRTFLDTCLDQSVSCELRLISRMFIKISRHRLTFHQVLPERLGKS